MRILILTAAGLAAAVAMSAPAAAEYRYDSYSDSYDYRGGDKVEREYREKFAEERRECSKKQREADSRGEWREAQYECRKKLVEVEYEYQEKLHEANRERYEDRRERDYDDDDYDDDKIRFAVKSRSRGLSNRLASTPSPVFSASQSPPV